MQSFRKPECKTFNGKCLAIIRPYAKAGLIKVYAEAAALPNAMIEVVIR